jgi:hypothetical protein
MLYRWAKNSVLVVYRKLEKGAASLSAHVSESIQMVGDSRADRNRD